MHLQTLCQCLHGMLVTERLKSEDLSGHHASSRIMSMSVWHASDKTLEV